MEAKTLRRIAAALSASGASEDAGLAELVQRLDKAADRGGAGLDGAAVLAMSEFQVMAHLDISFEQARRLREAVAAQVAPRVVAARQLLAQHAAVMGPLSVLELVPGRLVEVVGRAGAGKTQLCLSCAVDVVHREEKGVVYIDTENKFSVDRVVEIIRNRLGPAEDEERVRQLAGRILVYSPRTVGTLLSTLDSLDSTVIEHDAGLVVLDSIAALTRHASQRAELVKRQNMLARVSARLKLLSETCGAPVLVTNQMLQTGGGEARRGVVQLRTAERFGVANPDQMETTAAAGPGRAQAITMQPALGNTWAHCVNVRVHVSAEQGGHERFRRAALVKAPGSAERECRFEICAAGIVERAAS